MRPDVRSCPGDHAVPDLSTIEEEPMRFSIFSVADHYPEEPWTIRELYAQILDEIELADSLGFSAFFLAEHHFHDHSQTT